jgi:hypothetical protein
VRLVIAMSRAELDAHPGDHCVAVRYGPTGWSVAAYELTKFPKVRQQSHRADRCGHHLGSFESVRVPSAYDFLPEDEVEAEVEMWVGLVRVGGTVSVTALDAMSLFSAVAEGAESLAAAGEYLLHSERCRLTTPNSLCVALRAAGAEPQSQSNNGHFFTIEATRRE